MENHTIDAVYDNNSKILILGSFPSVKSREAGFFYGHPQNRFWHVVSAVMGEECPDTINEKKEMLLRNKIAVWDVIKSCDIQGSADSSIKNVTPNDISEILAKSLQTAVRHTHCLRSTIRVWTRINCRPQALQTRHSLLRD